MAFELFCAVVLALGFAALVAFAGYRFFLTLLPIWGFFFGFTLGAQTVQVLLPGNGFLGDVTSWVVALFVGVLFAVLSYLFYMFAVAFFSASLGYALGVSLMGLLGRDFALLTWLVGIVLAVVVAFAVLRFNIQKYVIVIGTALLGAGLATTVLLVGPAKLLVAQLFENPLRLIMNAAGPWAWLVFIVMAAAGIFVQLRSTATYTVEPYENRM